MKLILLFLNSFPRKDDPSVMLYQVTSKPSKIFTIGGIEFKIGKWSPSMATNAGEVTSGFANECTQERYDALCSIYPEGCFYLDLNSPDLKNPTCYSMTEYAELQASQSQSSSVSPE